MNLLSYTDKPLRISMLDHEHEFFDLDKKPTDEAFLWNQKVIINGLKNWYGIELPDDFSWQLRDDNGATLYTRIEDLFLDWARKNGKGYTHLTYDLKQVVERATGEAKSAVNNIFDWTFTVDWKSGDFGDSGSCYFPPGGYVECMHRNGIGAIRRYTHAKKGYGIARAWMAVDQPCNGTITIYNAYGRSTSCLYFAESLCQILKNLSMGDFVYNAINIDVDGNAHTNGDAAIVRLDGVVPEINNVTIRAYRESIGEI